METQIEKAQQYKCPATRHQHKSALTLLQEKWVLFIVNCLLCEGPMGFNEIGRRAADKINTTTLSQRLSLLEEVGVVRRTVHSTIPPRTSYELTEAGLALHEVIAAIDNWSARYLPETPPTKC